MLLKKKLHQLTDVEWNKVFKIFVGVANGNIPSEQVMGEYKSAVGLSRPCILKPTRGARDRCSWSEISD